MATKEKTEAQVISEAMGLLGKRTSEKKRAAVARNNAATRFQAKPLEALACICGKCPDSPKTYCPRGRAIIRRRAKAEAQAATAQASAQGSGDMTNEYSTVTQGVESNGASEHSASRNSLASALALRLGAASPDRANGRERTTDAARDLEALRDERFADAR